MLYNFDEVNINDKMLKCILSLENEFRKYNVTCVNKELITHLLIDYYGEKIFLNKISKITVDSNFVLRVSLFDKSIKNIVKKSISLSKLDLNISDNKDDILIYFPAITEERRIKLIKLLKNQSELSKISIRNIRREYKNKFKKMLKNKQISINKEQDWNKKLQKITNLYINKIENLFFKKKKKIINK